MTSRRFHELPSAPLAVGAAVGLFSVHAALSKIYDEAPSGALTASSPGLPPVLSEDQVAELAEKMAALIEPIVNKVEKQIFLDNVDIEKAVKDLWKISGEQHKRAPPSRPSC